MGSDPKAQATPAPKKEAPAPKKEAPAPKKEAIVAEKSTPDAAPPKTEAPKTEAPKTEGGEKAAATPKDYSRGEGQKPVTQAYKDNWNAIFGTDTKKKKKR